MFEALSVVGCLQSFAITFPALSFIYFKKDELYLILSSGLNWKKSRNVFSSYIFLQDAQITAIWIQSTT